MNITGKIGQVLLKAYWSASAARASERVSTTNMSYPLKACGLITATLLMRLSPWLSTRKTSRKADSVETGQHHSRTARVCETAVL
jgi:hypothetical protein